MPIFISGRGFGFTRDPSTSSHSKENNTKKKKAVVLKDQDERGEKVGKNWLNGEVPPHCSKRKIGA